MNNFDGFFLCCPFSPRDALDEISDLTETVSEGFPISLVIFNKKFSGINREPGMSSISQAHILGYKLYTLNTIQEPNVPIKQDRQARHLLSYCQF